MRDGNEGGERDELWRGWVEKDGKIRGEVWEGKGKKKKE